MNRASEIAKAISKNNNPYKTESYITHGVYDEPQQDQQLTVVCNEFGCRVVNVEKVDLLRESRCERDRDRERERERERENGFVENRINQRRGFGGRRTSGSRYGSGGCSSCK